ncbi:MAG: hypothetical protein JRE24_11955 [Deltaproteobacteria bacterium]|jgi:hypothetical protein|nr:hypothetical protein [Deltaproteobacteria bacterium]
MKAHKARHIARIEAMMMTSVMLNICGKSDNHDMATPPLVTAIQYEREHARLMQIEPSALGLAEEKEST